MKIFLELLLIIIAVAGCSSDDDIVVDENIIVKIRLFNVSSFDYENIEVGGYGIFTPEFWRIFGI